VYRYLFVAPIAIVLIAAFVVGHPARGGEVASPAPNEPVIVDDEASMLAEVCPPREIALGKAAGTMVATPVLGWIAYSPAVGLPTTVTVTLVDGFSDPCALAVPAITPVDIIVSNKGSTATNFVIDALDIRIEGIKPGEIRHVAINVMPGTYEFRSETADHVGAEQTGTLIALVVATVSATPMT
jgi:hypothetical protein